MQNISYQMGRKAGKLLTKGKWVFKSNFGSDEEAILAEYAVGRSLEKQILTEIKPSPDQAKQAFLQDIGAALCERVKKKQRRFKFTVFVSNEINAFALPGGFIFCSEGLLNISRYNKNEIAFVLAHEMVHVVSGHPLKRITTNASLNVIANALRTSGVVGNLAKQTLTNLIRSSYSQEHEFKADLYGMQLMQSAGFEPGASIDMLQRIRQAHLSPEQKYSYFSSHPQIEDRINNLQRILKRRT